MMRPEEPAPTMKNPYRPEDYFKLDVQRGVVTSATGTRMVAIPEQLLQGLQAGLVEETGSAAPVVLYTIGKWWGQRYAKRHADEVKRYTGKELHELPLGAYVQSLRRSWGMLGWGELAISLELSQRGFVLADVDGAPYSTSIGQAEKPTDHLVAGVLAALVGDISARPLACVEIACKSQGDPRCTFVIGTEERLQQVSTWVKERRSATEILDALRRGDAR